MNGNKSRILKVNLSSGAIREEFFYDEVAARMFRGGARNGVAGRAGIPTNVKLIELGLIEEIV